MGLNALIYSGKGRTVRQGLSEVTCRPCSTWRGSARSCWPETDLVPPQYCSFDPMQLELGVKGCTAALYNMCIEPDGAVIPCQSYYQPVGNMLADPWKSIWNNDLCIWL